MKKIIVMLGLAGFTAFAAGCSAGATDAELANEGAREDGVTASASARIETVTIDESKPAMDLVDGSTLTSCTLTGDYVKVSGLAPVVEQTINEALVPPLLMELQGGCEDAYEASVSTKVLFNDKGVLSVQHTESIDYAGAAHPSNNLWVRSFSLKTGDQLRIADVFADATGKQLAHEVIAALETGTEEQQALAEGFKDQILERPDWMNFALTKDSVVVYLTSYVPHAAFALATEPVELRYSDLRDALDGASEAAALWASAP